MNAVSPDNRVSDALRNIISGHTFTADGGGLTGTVQEGDPTSRVVLVVGDNTPHQGEVLHAIWSTLNAAYPPTEGPWKRSWLLLDEPDAGLAEGYCTALSTYLANVGNRLQGSQEGLIITSQSRKLMCALTFHLQLTPHLVCLGQYSSDDPFQAWLEDERERTEDELLALMNVPGGHWSGLEKLIQANLPA